VAIARCSVRPRECRDVSGARVAGPAARKLGPSVQPATSKWAAAAVGITRMVFLSGGRLGFATLVIPALRVTVACSGTELKSFVEYRGWTFKFQDGVFRVIAACRARELWMGFVSLQASDGTSEQ